MAYKLLYFTTLLIAITLSYQEEIEQNDNIHSCNLDSDCKNMYFCKNKICIHKNIFPLTLVEIITFLVVSVSYGISNLCGIGGGVVATTALLWAENFSTSEAVPITMFTMVFASAYTFYLAAKFKKDNKDSDFANYKLAAVLIPMMLFGSKIGAILNFTLPYLITSGCLIILVANQLYKTKVRYDLRVQEEEKISHEEKGHKDSLDSTLLKKVSSDKVPIEKKKTLDFNRESHINMAFTWNVKNTFSSDEPVDNDINTVKLKKILEEESDPFSMRWLKVILLTFAIYLFDIIIEGNSKVSSLIGIQMCSIPYFITFGLSCFLYIYLVIRNRKIILENLIEKQRLDPKFSDELEENLCSSSNHEILVYSFLGGVVSGTLGIGGGMVFTPFLISKGYSPQTTTKTVGLTIIFSALSTSVMFAMKGTLKVDYGLLLVIPTLISCFFFSTIVNNYIKRTGKQSILLFSLIWILILSLVLAIFSIKNRIIYNLNNDIGLLRFNNYCKG